MALEVKMSMGTRKTPPRRNRTAMNVKGPTCRIPIRWATKANPHIAAAVRKTASYLRTVVFESIDYEI